MKAVVVHAFGDTPRFEEFADPIPNDENEVKVQVLATGLHPIVKVLANGPYYGSAGILPMIPGRDGVGRLPDGTRVYFSMARAPYGTMSEWTVVSRQVCTPLPDSIDDITAAAIINPGISSWVALKWRAQLKPGETVLILGATGAAGKLAVQIAKIFGARKVIVVGRNEQILQTLPALGADVTISLNQPDAEFKEAVTAAVREHGIDVVVDYLWGAPSESVMETIVRRGPAHAASRVRFVNVGQMAGGATIVLPALTLRSTAIEVLGSGIGTVPRERMIESTSQLIGPAASGKLQIDTERVPLAEVEAAWTRQPENNRRIVFIP